MVETLLVTQIISRWLKGVSQSSLQIVEGCLIIRWYFLTIILWLKGVTISIPMLGTLQYWQNCCIPVPNSVNISCFDSTDLQMLLMTSCFTTMITRKLNEQCLTRMWPDFHDADRWGHWNASQSIKYLMLQWIAVYIWILDAKSETTRIRNPPCQKGRNTSLLYKLCFAASLSCCIYIYINIYIKLLLKNHEVYRVNQGIKPQGNCFLPF